MKQISSLPSLKHKISPPRQDPVVKRYNAMIPKNCISWEQFLAELRQCKLVQHKLDNQRRAAIKKSKPKPPLTKWEKLQLDMRQRQDEFPETNWNKLPTVGIRQDNKKKG